MTGAVAAEVIILVMTLVLVGWAAWLDWRSRRIPNWLTVSALALGIIVNTAAWGWAGTKVALTGAGLGLGLLLPFVMVRGLGAGDWKLIGALGAFLRWRNLLLVLIASIFVGGIMAMVETIRRRRIRQTLANLWLLLQTLVTFGLRRRQDLPLTLDNAELMSLPFGVAVALATVSLLGIEIVLRIL